MKLLTTLHLVKLVLVLVLLVLSVGTIVADIQAQMTPGYRFKRETLLIALSGNTEAINRLRPALKTMWTDRFSIVEREATQSTLIQVGREVNATKGVLVDVTHFNSSFDRETKDWHTSIQAQVYLVDIERAEFLYSGTMTESTPVFASDDTEGQAMMGALNRLVKTISRHFSETSPLRARIMDRKGNLVTFDMGSAAGIGRGTRFDVLSNGSKVGLIEVVRVTNRNSTAKILRGGSRIKVGTSVKERAYQPRWGISVTRSFLPAKGEAREGWEEPIDGATPYHFSVVWEEAANKRWIWQYSLGVSTLKLSESWEGVHVDFRASRSHEVIISEVLYYSIGGAIGFGKTSRSKWVKEGTHYEGGDFFLMLDIFTGLSFRLGFIQISGDIGYIHFGGVGEESFEEEGGPSLSSEEFMYKDLSVGGFRTSVGFAVLF